MLHINELSFRIEGRPILEAATVAIPAGHKVGLIGRNGAGKTTLLRLIAGELAPDSGTITMPKLSRTGYVAQEAPGGEDSLLDWVLAADRERLELLAEAQTATDPHRIADIQLRLTDIGAYSAPARAAQILAGLGFDETAQRTPCREFSGGWRMRVALASVLFLEPELLLLDEPTNYLDIEGTIWLETYLRGYPHTVLTVSHDRDLLNRAVTSIVHLDRGTLTLYAGGYDAFEEARRARQQLDLKLKKKQDDERRRIEVFINRFKAKASKAAQAQSRVKALAKMQPIAAQIEERVAPFHFPQPQKRLANPLLRLEGVSVGYFAQHQIDELDPEWTPYTYIAQLMPEATEAQKRTRLGAYGFGGDKADTKCKHLSGGEKARLLFMLTAFPGPHLLILDEPTNHLDVDSREALVRALNEYEGAVILISHDRHLVEASADRLWIVRNRTVAPYEGDLGRYRQELLSERTARSRSRPSEMAAEGRRSRADQRRAAAERRAGLAPLKVQMTNAEAEAERIARHMEELDRTLADPAVYERDPARAADLARERGQLRKALSAAECAWLDAMEAYEAAARPAKAGSAE